MNKLDKQYQDLLDTILEYGVDKGDRTGTGTKSIFGYTIRHKMSDGFPLLTTKKMPFKIIVTELLWFLRGDTNIKYLVDNGCNIWNGDAYKKYKSFNGNYLTERTFIDKIKTNDKFAQQWGELGNVYGAQWRNWGGTTEVNSILETTKQSKPGIDQIDNLITQLKSNPDSRRLMVNAWNVGELEGMTLPPCHYGFQMYSTPLSSIEVIAQAKADGLWDDGSGFDGTDGFSRNSDGELFHEYLGRVQSTFRKRKLSLMWNQRSVDTFLGLPFNIASYGLLLELIAKEANMVADELVGNLGDVHLYSNHLEQAKEQISRTPFDLPQLVINDEFWNPDVDIMQQLPYIEIDDFFVTQYQHQERIKAPLSN